MKTQLKSKLSSQLKNSRSRKNAKSKAHVRLTSKADMIRKLLNKRLSPSKIAQKLQEQGINVYASEIYRLVG